MEVNSARRRILSVRNVSYTYGSKVVALEGVSLDVYTGEVVSVLGPNGAGKTTLLKCILGLLHPRGAVYIDGKEVSKMRSRELAKIMGYVPQSHSTLFAYRVVDYVLMGRAPHHGLLSLPSRDEYEKALKVLRDLGIEDLAYRTIAELSGGQLQLVLIARALIQEARILILDEPIAHLDVANRIRVLKTVRSLVDSGRVEAAIMSLHDPYLAALFSDKIALLHSGRVIAYGTPEKVLTGENLYRVYGVRFRVLKLDGRLFVVPEP